MSQPTSPNLVKRRVLVIGGSVGGLFAANLLQRCGWDVTIFERANVPLNSRGAGIATHPKLLKLLGKAGVTIGSALGVHVTERITFDQDGSTLGTCYMPQVMTGWSRLYQVLQTALLGDCYRMGTTLTDIEQDGDGVTAIFADGERVQGDLLIGADGIRSTVRTMFLPDVKANYAGYVAWRGMVDEGQMSAETHSTLFNKFTFCLPHREQILAYPIAGEGDVLTPGLRRYNYVWYRPANKVELARLLTDDEGRQHLDGIPPSSIRGSVLDELRSDADRKLSPHFAEIVRRTSQPFLQGIYDLESPRMVFGRVVILGDAAFVARPHPAMGVLKAADDAATLVDALKEVDRCEMDVALARWQAIQIVQNVRIVDHARNLGAYLQAGLLSGKKLDMAGRHQTPEMVMKETAVPPPGHF